MASDLTAFPITTKKVSELASGTTLDGAEALYSVQSTTSKKVTVAEVRKSVIESVTANHTTDAKTEVLLCDATSGAITVTLHTAAGSQGQKIYIKKIDSSANNVIVDGDGSETIDGSATVDLSSQYEALTITSNNLNWFIL